jgi:hypothetical protein
MTFCVFCGDRFQGAKRTKEHLLPMWLLKATGDPNRSFRIGSDNGVGGGLIRPASSFHFPACETCNNRYGRQLETQAQKIITAVSSGRSISVAQAYRLLDWLDKVRTGLWLGYYILRKETSFHPKFYINTRLGAKDRLAIVSVDPNDHSKFLSFGGHDNNLFHKSQCGIYLRINNIRILSLSFDFLLRPETGLPGADELLLVPGNQVLSLSNLKFGSFDLAQDWKLFSMSGGTVLAQPIIDSRFLDPAIGINWYFNSRVIEHAKDKVRIQKPSDCQRILALQLISNADKAFRYYPNKRVRIRFCHSHNHSDAAFMHHLYALVLGRILPLFPRDIRMPDGSSKPSMAAYEDFFICSLQIVMRIAQMGLPVPDTSEVVEELQKVARIIEERDAFLRGYNLPVDVNG